MKTNEQTPQGEAALLAQISTLQKQLEDCLEPGKKKDRLSEIETLYASYDPAILKAGRDLLSYTYIRDYIEVLEDSYRALVMSKSWKEFGKDYRDDASYRHNLLMGFLRKLQIIEAQRTLEREIRGI